VSGKAAFILGDSGQFLFDKERVTAIIDVELGYIGDPAADLAGLFVRDVSEPLGDIGHAIDHYDQCMGRPVNRRAVMYHAIRWGLSTPLHVANMIARPPRSLEYIQYLGWYLVYQRTPLQQIAYLENIELEEPATPEAMTTPYSVAHDALLDRLQGFKTNSDTQAYDLDRLIRLQQYLHRADRYGPDVDRQALDEAQEILGTRPTSLLQCDQLLVEFIAGSAGESDADLVQYFYRRFRRQEFLLKGVLRELEGASVQMLEL
ncbi:MAG: hypothetical protein HOC23_05250, partial [Halieaceae bacterium]|nr:hypothetical protein [Halieaceae bacterium]